MPPSCTSANTAHAGDPRYIDKVAPAKLFVQSTPGDFRPLEVQKLSDRLRAHLPLEGSLMVAGELDYGVLTRPMLAPFLLRHYSKAVAGKPEEVNRLQAKGSPLEIVARFDADAVVLTALLNGKPMPSAKFTTVDSDLTSEELVGDSDGQVRFVPGAPGVWSVYIQHLDATPGTHAGESYKEVRQFATLSFSWPLARTDADAEAVVLFEGGAGCPRRLARLPRLLRRDCRRSERSSVHRHRKSGGRRQRRARPGRRSRA